MACSCASVDPGLACLGAEANQAWDHVRSTGKRRSLAETARAVLGRASALRHRGLSHPPHPDLPEPHQESPDSANAGDRCCCPSRRPHRNNVEAAPRANARSPVRSSTRRRTPVPSPNSAAVSRAVVRSFVASSAPSGSIPVLRSALSRGSQGRSPGIRQPHVRRYFLMAPM